MNQTQKRINRLIGFNYCPAMIRYMLSGCYIFLVSIAVHAQAPAGYSHQHLLLRDEGISQIAYIDIKNPDKNWYTPVPTGRDVQLVGNGRVLVGTGNGYEEYELTTGKKVAGLNSYPGTLVARRLRNGNTLLTGVNWQQKQGIVLLEVNATGAIEHLINYPGFDYVRLVRETAAGNFLVTANNILFEGTRDGKIIWKAVIGDAQKMHAWQALRLKNGQTVVSTGYGKNLSFFSADGKQLDTISGPAAVHPNFFAGFQVLPNGNYIVANWQGHGPAHGKDSTQVLEYAPGGKLVWSWQPDAGKCSSLHAVIVLDDLDPSLMYAENENGVLTPVKQ